jgi:hypothetical protein
MTDEKEKDFKITDRRKFNSDGSLRESPGADQVSAEQGSRAESSAAPAPAAEPQAPAGEPGGNVLAFPDVSAGSEAQPAAPTPAQAAETPPGAATGQTPMQKEVEQAYKQTSDKQKTSLPPPSFLAIVNMLAVEAGMHLGMVNMPGHEEQPIDLESARQLIDLLGILRAKSRGNLTAEEETLFEGLLADLRMQFVSLSHR